MSDDEGSDNGEPQYQVVFEGDEPSRKPDKYLRRDGRAAAKFANEDTYVGEYQNGKRHGKGVYTFASGAKYEGEYQNGLKHGQGSMLTLDGGKYTGGWVNDKREGQGTYVYANGDAYTGGWLADRKHGRGTYTYAKNGSSITGQWSNGKIMHGEWSTADGARFVGAWHNNQPSGLGLHTFASGAQATGYYSVHRKEGYKWTTTAPVLSNPSAAAPSTPAAFDPLKVATRFIQKALLKSDHFEGIYRIKKEVDGCPNLRKVSDLSVFAMGQPTRAGLQAFVEWAGEQHSTDKFVWVNFRSEPVVYVNEQSYVPRSKHALNEPMSLAGLKAGPAAGAAAADPAASGILSAAQLEQIESALAAKLTKDISHRGNLHVYLKDTYAERPADRKNLELSEEVKEVTDEETGEQSFADAIQTPVQVFTTLAEEGGVDVEYTRMPLASGSFPSAKDVDALVQLIKVQEPSTGLVFNDQMGRGRATLGAIIATLMRRTADALTTADERVENNPSAGRTDIEGLDLPEYDDADPNLRLGQYSLIMRLVRTLAPANAPAGWSEQLKAEVDDAIDRCKALQHVREAILFARDMADKEAAAAVSGAHGAPVSEQERAERQQFWLDNARSFVERYAGLLLFHAYVKANAEGEYEQQTYAQFVDSKKQLIEECIGTRSSGPLSEFKWQ